MKNKESVHIFKKSVLDLTSLKFCYMHLLEINGKQWVLMGSKQNLNKKVEAAFCRVRKRVKISVFIGLIIIST